MAIMTPNRPKRWRRRLVTVVATFLILIIGTIAGLPWLLSSAPAKRWIVGKINRSLGKGQVEIGSISASWLGPIRVQGLQIKGRQDKPLLVAPTATIDRGLWQLLSDRNRLGTILIEGPSLDLERRADGSLDLAEALGFGARAMPSENAPVPKHVEAGPRLDLTVKIVNGSLRFRSPELGDPFQADRLDATLRIPGDNTAITWDLAIASKAGETLDAVGSAGQEGLTPALKLDLTARRWPVHLLGRGVVLKGRLDGKVGVRRTGETLDLSGDARLMAIDATGPALSGDRIVMDAFGGTWDVTQDVGGWSIRTLNLSGPLASVRSDGAIPASPGHPSTLRATIDLAAVAKQAPNALRLRDGLTLTQGSIDLRVDVNEEQGTQKLEARASLSDLRATDPARPSPVVLLRPATLTSTLSSRGADVRVETIRLATGWITAEGAGDLTSGVKYVATFDLAGLKAQLGELMDLGSIDLGGKGSARGDYRRGPSGYVARASGDVHELSIAGLTGEPFRRDRIVVEATATGMADVTGIPVGWASANVALGDGTVSVAASAGRRRSALDIAATATIPTSAGKLVIVMDSAWSNSILDLHSATISYAPAHGTPVSIAISGKVDAGRGDIVFAPLPTPTSTSLALGPKGLRVAGLYRPDLDIEAQFTGDLGSIDRALSAFMGSSLVGMEGQGVLTMKGRYEKAHDVLTIGELGAWTRYGSAGVSGKVAAITGGRRAELNVWPSIEPAIVNAFVTSHLAEDARVAVRVKAIRIVGPLAADHWKEIDAWANLDLERADAFGLRLGASPIAAHLIAGRVEFNPILSTLNGGRVELRPLLTFEEAGGATLRLLDGSIVENVAIDDEVSKRILSYAAPILRDATRVRGHLTASLAHAEFPVAGGGSQAIGLEGRIALKDLRFGPGPMARDVLNLGAGGEEPEVRINEEISVAVVNGRVYQKGLSVDLGRGRKVALEGSVGFDTTLALRALVPLAAFPGLKGEAGATHIPVAIGGTFAKPTIDRNAMARALKGESGKALRREAESQARDLLKRLGPIEDRIPRRQ